MVILHITITPFIKNAFVFCNIIFHTVYYFYLLNIFPAAKIRFTMTTLDNIIKKLSQVVPVVVQKIRPSCRPKKTYFCRMKKEHILFGVIVFALVVASRAQTVYQKDRWGAKLYYMQENTIRMKDRWGEPLLWYDAAARQVRQKDRWGQPLIYMDGQTVRLKDRWGEPLLYFDGLTIRQKDRWGTPLYYLDGQTLRQKDRWGAPVYYFDFIPDRWQIACLILM